VNKVSKCSAAILVFLLILPFVSYDFSTLVKATETYVPKITTVDSDAEVGMYSSLALDSASNPHISYFDLTNQDLKYASWTGESWVIETVDSEGAVGEYCSLALDSAGNPHISYFDSLNYDLKYAVKEGLGWSIQVVDSSDCDLYCTSIALDSTGKPHIIYGDYIFHRTNSTLKYAAWTGSAWSIQTVDTIISGPGYCSIALDSLNKPHLSYSDDGMLKYACWSGSQWNIQIIEGWNVTGVFTSRYFDDSDGFLGYAEWNGTYWNVHTRDGLIVLENFTASAGYFSDIVLDSNDRPRIVYSSSGLRYATWNGLSWNIQIVDSAEAWWYPSIALNSEDEAHISYFNTVDGLYYAIQTGSGWFIQDLDTAGNADSSIALDPDGYTHISYYDRSNDDLKYIVLSSDPAKAATSRIQINPDGTVEGTVKIQRNGDTYTFTDDIDVYPNRNRWKPNGCLLVGKDNVIIDGAGHTLEGHGNPVGIYLRSMHNITVKNLKITGFPTGISSFYCDASYLHTSFQWPLDRPASDLKIENNEISTINPSDVIDANWGGWGGWGIHLDSAQNTLISGNIIETPNPTMGLFVGDCQNTVIVDNKFVGCGLQIQSLSQSILVNNVIDDKPVVSLRGVSDSIIDYAEQIFLYNCTRIEIRDFTPRANYPRAIQLEETSDSLITNCRGNMGLTGSNNNTICDSAPNSIILEGSNGNRISSNNITETGQGLTVTASANNEIYGNRFSDCPSGIQLDNCHYNKIYQNLLANHDNAIECEEVTNTQIYSNIISDCSCALALGASRTNSFFQNNITDTDCGVSISGGGGDNAFFHNNFFNVGTGASEQHKEFLELMYGLDLPDIYSTNNSWDAGYPAGGNYWTNYNGTDENADGIGDTYYVVSEDYMDRYPLMKAFVQDLFEVTEENRSVPIEYDPTFPDDATASLLSNTGPDATSLFMIAAALATAIVSVGVILSIYFKKRGRRQEDKP
jgi:parallel beta-helix repeat protein